MTGSYSTRDSSERENYAIQKHRGQKECRHITYSFARNKVEVGDFKIGGQIIHTVKYADDLVLLAKEEKVLRDIFFYISPFIVPPVLLQTISTLMSLLMACRKCIQ